MVALSFAARHVEPGSGDYWCWRAFADRCPMQDSNPQADGNAEARSRDEWRSDRSADTMLRDGARIPTPADCAGAASALEEGVWGRNLLKVSPQLAQPQRLKTRHPIKPLPHRT